MKVAVAKNNPSWSEIYSLAIHESAMHERELSSSLSDRHGMADCGLDAHASHTWSMRNGAFGTELGFGQAMLAAKNLTSLLHPDELI